MNRSFNHDPIFESSASPGGRVNKILLWLGLFGAPVSWIAQVFFSEPLAAHACYPYQVPLSAPIWQGVPAILAAVSIACFTVALLSGLAAWALWRKSESTSVGEDRNRFLASLSLMSSFIFIIAIVFNICAVLLVPLCS